MEAGRDASALRLGSFGLTCCISLVLRIRLDRVDDGVNRLGFVGGS